MALIYKKLDAICAIQSGSAECNKSCDKEQISCAGIRIIRNMSTFWSWINWLKGLA